MGHLLVVGAGRAVRGSRTSDERRYRGVPWRCSRAVHRARRRRRGYPRGAAVLRGRGSLRHSTQDPRAQVVRRPAPHRVRRPGRRTMTRTVDEPELLAPGEAVDLDNCAREPIHVPGLIQPRGVLLVVREADGVLLQASANVERYLGAAADDLAGRPLADALGEQPARLVLDHAASVADLATRNPVARRLARWGGSTDEMVRAVLHRPPLPAEGPGAEPVLVVELETAAGARPLTFPNTYLAVRHALRDLERAASLTELYDDAARHVRALTGFDRVMIYRFDADYNGEVVAEARRDDLHSFRGLHSPASDIPPQARAPHPQ